MEALILTLIVAPIAYLVGYRKAKLKYDQPQISFNAKEEKSKPKQEI